MPIHFICPHCGTTTEVADEYAGQSGSCLRCRQKIIVPSPSGFSPFSSVKGRRFPFEVKALVVALVAFPVLGILIALLLPAVQAAREAARLMQCGNQLKQIGLAMHNYHQQYGCFPPAFVANKNGKPMHSWRVLLLPYLEQQALHDQYRFDEPWNGPHNLALAERVPRVYRCPTEWDNTSQTSYAMIVGPHAISDGPTPRGLGDIKDGTSNAIMVAECAGAGINWLEPRDLNTQEMSFQINHRSDNSEPNTSNISSAHSGVANVLFCDGSVRLLSDTLDAKTLEALTTIDGGEKVDF